MKYPMLVNLVVAHLFDNVEHITVFSLAGLCSFAHTDSVDIRTETNQCLHIHIQNSEKCYVVVIVLSLVFVGVE